MEPDIYLTFEPNESKISVWSVCIEVERPSSWYSDL